MLKQTPVANAAPTAAAAPAATWAQTDIDALLWPRLRPWVGALALLYVAFMVYGSLVPLQAVALPLDVAWQRFMATRWADTAHVSRTALAVNVVLTVPLALLLRAWLHPLPAAADAPPASGFSALLRGLGTWGVCAALSVAVEFAQVFFPARSHAWSDVLAQWLGAAIGLGLYAWRGAALRRWAGGWFTIQHGQPMAVWLLQGWLLALLAAALVPLDLTISPVEIYHKWRDGRIHLLPFADLPAGWVEAAWQLASDGLLWAPVGILWRLQGRSLRAAALGGLVAALLIEMLQLFVFSRVSSSTDVLVGAAGCLLGAACTPQRKSPPADGAAQPAPGAHPAGRASARWLAALGAWAVLVVLAYWYPYQVDFTPEPLRARLREALTRMPFEALFFSTEQRAVTELLRKPLMFVPGGLLWAAWQARRAMAVRPVVGGVWLVLAAVLATLVEAGQLAMPGKLADPTDVVLGVLGGWLGWVAGQRLWTPQSTVGAAVEQGAQGGAGQALAQHPTTPQPAGRLAVHRPGASPGLNPPIAAVPWALFAAACLAFAGFIAWRGLAGAPAPGPGTLGPALVLVWAVLAALPALTPRWPWVGLAAFLLALWTTPRYGADMQWMLALPLLPGIALATAGGWWWALRARGKVPRLALVPDGLFGLFLVWVLLLAAWHASTGNDLGTEALYHPVNYVYAALLYLAARTDSCTAAEQRRLAMVLVAGVLAAAALHIGLERFHLNGHIAFLMAMAVPLAWASMRSAPDAAQRVVGSLALGLLVAGVVVNQNRSAMLSLAVLGLLAWPAVRRRQVLAAMLMLVLGMLGLWWLGLLDRFVSVLEPSWARRFDAMAEATVDSRLALWRASLEMLSTAPLTGVGPGQFEAMLARLSPATENVPAHNTWLTLACETGIIGVVLAALAFLLAALSPKQPLVQASTKGPPNWSPQAMARQGLLVWLIFGLFNSRPDFAWAYFLAGWAVAWPPAQPRRRGHRQSAAGTVLGAPDAGTRSAPSAISAL